MKFSGNLFYKCQVFWTPHSCDAQAFIGIRTPTHTSPLSSGPPSNDTTISNLSVTILSVSGHLNCIIACVFKEKGAKPAPRSSHAASPCASLGRFPVIYIYILQPLCQRNMPHRPMAGSNDDVTMASLSSCKKASLAQLRPVCT